MPEKELPNQMPFGGEWKGEFADKPDLYSSDKFENKIIRHDWVNRKYGIRGNIDREQAVKEFGVFKQTIDDAQGYGIRFPKFDIVFGKHPEGREDSSYIVVDKIEGIGMGKIEEPSAELILELIDYCKAVSEYYKDSYDQNSNWFGDLGLHQVLWGHKKDENENHLYNVDVEIRNVHQNERWPVSPAEFKRGSLALLRDELKRLLSQVHGVEESWNVNLQEAKIAILTAYRYLTGGKEPKIDVTEFKNL